VREDDAGKKRVIPEKKIVIIAGPNGAGKTTFAREFLPNEAGCPVFVFCWRKDHDREEQE